MKHSSKRETTLGNEWIVDILLCALAAVIAVGYLVWAWHLFGSMNILGTQDSI